MADEFPKKDITPKPDTGWFGMNFEDWLVKAGHILLWIIVLIVVLVYIVPIAESVPVGTWVWRAVLITAISYGGYKSGKLWLKYIRTEHIQNLEWTLLYIKLPRTVARSPMAMETVLNALWDTGGTGTWRHLFWDGAVRKWATLEIASVEGKVYFFIRCISKSADFVRSQIYAQYPETEIFEVDDYVKYVPPFDPSKSSWKFDGFELESEKGDILPIKSYIDWGLDKPGKPEERMDPLANFTEILANLGPGEQYWIQIHIRAAAARFPAGEGSPKKLNVEKYLQAELKKYETEVQENIKKQTISPELEFTKKRITEHMTTFEKDMYTAIQRHQAKRVFDVGVRCVYFARADSARGTAGGAIEGAFRLYSAPGLNGLKAMNNTQGFPHPFDNVLGTAGNKRRENLYNAYIHRSYFYPPFDEWVDKKPRKIMLMSTEELATIFHFPGEEVATGGLSRVEARKAEAPANLPVS